MGGREKENAVARVESASECIANAMWHRICSVANAFRSGSPRPRRWDLETLATRSLSTSLSETGVRLARRDALRVRNALTHIRPISGRFFIFSRTSKLRWRGALSAKARSLNRSGEKTEE